MEGVIELTKERIVKRSWKARLTLFFAKLFLFLLFWLITAHYVQLGYAIACDRLTEWNEWVLNKLTVVKYVTEFRRSDEAKLGEIIDQVSREQNIDPLILRVIADKESSGGIELYHFEPDQYERRAAIDRRLGLSDDDRRMENSSHGPFHVMGYTARSECKLHWSELYNPWVSARCAASIVARRWNELSSIKNSGERLRLVYKAYNGSGPKSEEYASDAMNRIAKLLYQGIGKTAHS